ncbi:ATP-binding protein [Solwaraspora sp. WMMD1047]|uniref:sensor histidine kinase n=1 Tax=Solwaraspora sp. WMMD1047 TaxID=3016102 RepID=UPI002416B5DB|nr:ATP-binding protein [Solwaraspora sp. WMMD1047]MDG4830770.1 ATP-binding protein [Solwaraspora sp. WMMD1047]
MSFRLRVLLLVVAVAVTATGATAWLTLSQASRQFAASATVDEAQIEMVGSRLREYGERHGTWEGVPAVVNELYEQTGQRLHLVSESGVVIVDTDTLQQRDTRPLGSATTFVDPRPQLALPGGLADAAAITTKAIVDYRVEVRLAACLTRHGLDVTVSPGPFGVPRFSPGVGSDISVDADPVDRCRQESGTSGDEVESAVARVDRCAAAIRAGPVIATPPELGRTDLGAAEVLNQCLSQAFTDEIGDVAPVPAQVFLGTRGEPAFSLSTGPLLAAASGVAAVVIVGTVLLSHRVLRPIGTLTAAAHRLGRGDLASRVPVRGTDELAELGRSFNRMADSLRRGEERQRRMVADVAHELRTPLANLRGYLEALADGVVAPTPELFASLHEEAVLQQRIVDDLQELALAESGRLAYHRGRVDLADLLENCRTAHQAMAATAGVTLTVVADRPGPSGYADPDRLRQVLGNLITNALRATPPGGTVSLATEPAGDGAVIRVTDTGVGIDEAALPYIFDRFWRADGARGRRTGGGGLGLAIARQIITDHGGTITATSRPGAGTAFTITLPAAGGPDHPPVPGS